MNDFLKRVFLFFLILVLPHVSRADDADAKRELAIQLFIRDLTTSGAEDNEPGLKTLKNTIRIFHYFWLPEIYEEVKTPEGRKSFVNRYLDSASARFWDLSYHANQFINAGPGLYLALDPFVSESFGNTFLEMTVPVGTLTLNVVAPVAILPDTINAMTAAGFLTPKIAASVFVPVASGIYNYLRSSRPQSATRKAIAKGSRFGLYRDSLKNMALPENETFRVFLQLVLRRLDIHIIEYNWKAELYGFCKYNPQSAFNYIGSPDRNGPDSAQGIFRNVPFYSKLDLPNLTSDELTAAARALKLKSTLAQIRSLRNQQKAIPPRFLMNFYAPAELNDVQSQLFQCLIL